MYQILFFFFFNDTPPTEIYTTTDTLSLHDALPISRSAHPPCRFAPMARRRHSERSEEHTSELQSPVVISYAVFCLKKKKKQKNKNDMCLYIIKDNKQIIKSYY